MKTIRVVAAVIRDGDRIFSTARGYGDYKGWWEFPGGKIEPGESPQQALVREIREELTAEIEVGDLIRTVEYDYPEFHLSMDCFWASIKSGHLELKEAESARWLSAEELDEVKWLPADRLLIDPIAGALRLGKAVASSDDRLITDIHMHVLPGVDDGADSMEMSLEMIRRAKEQGVRTIFCTPHDIGYRGKSEEVGKRFLALRDACAEIMPEMRLYKGCELYCALYKMDKNFEYLADGTYPTMNGTDYVLTEFPIRDLSFPEVRQMCRQLMEYGVTPILAHTERFGEIIEEIDNVAELKEMGCLVQVNAYSLAEGSDDKRSYWAEQLLQRRMIDFIGSDSHGTDFRPPRYAKGVDRIYETCDRDYADAVCFGNAEKLLIAAGG